MIKARLIQEIISVCAANYCIAGFFRRHLFSRILRISASRENIVCEILRATPSSRSAPTWVWSGFGLIAKIFFAKFTPVSNSRKYRSANPPAIRYTVKLIAVGMRVHTVLAYYWAIKPGRSRTATDFPRSELY